MQCGQCGLENAVGRLTCRGCGTFLADADWDAAPTLSITESPLYQGLVAGEECSLVQVFQELCRQLERGEIDEASFAEGLRLEVSRLAEFVEGVERTLYPEGLSLEALSTAEEFLQLFHRAVDGFALAADLLIEARAFEPGRAAAGDAASLLAQAFNAGELALRSPQSD